MSSNVFATISNWVLGSYKVRANRLSDGSYVQVVGLSAPTTNDSLTALAPESATIGTSSTQVVASNTNRRGIKIFNVSSNRVFLAKGTAAIMNKGIYLAPGGHFEMSGIDFSTAQINAIASGSGSVVTIQEYQ